MAKENATFRNLAIVVVLILVIVPIVVLVLLTLMFKPLLALVADAEVIAEGDFTQSFETDRSDEIGMLSKSLNHISTGLKDMFNVIGKMSNEVASTSEQISASSEELPMKKCTAMW